MEGVLRVHTRRGLSVFILILLFFLELGEGRPSKLANQSKSLPVEIAQLISVLLSRDPPSCHFGRAFGRVWAGRATFKTLPASGQVLHFKHFFLYFIAIQ